MRATESRKIMPEANALWRTRRRNKNW